MIAKITWSRRFCGALHLHVEKKGVLSNLLHNEKPTFQICRVKSDGSKPLHVHH